MGTLSARMQHVLEHEEEYRPDGVIAVHNCLILLPPLVVKDQRIMSRRQRRDLLETRRLVWLPEDHLVQQHRTRAALEFAAIHLRLVDGGGCVNTGAEGTVCACKPDVERGPENVTGGAFGVGAKGRCSFTQLALTGYAVVCKMFVPDLVFVLSVRVVEGHALDDFINL